MVSTGLKIFLYCWRSSIKALTWLWGLAEKALRPVFTAALGIGYTTGWRAGWSGTKIVDLTSGFRAVRAGKFKQFLYLLPNGFSYPTTITMSFFRAGYGVAYVPIHAPKRIGGSHLRLVKDGLRFFLIIFKIGSLYSPLKLFAPAAFLHFMLGISYYAYTFATQHRLSSMTVFLLSASVTIFMIGLVSEQITALMYKDSSGRE